MYASREQGNYILIVFKEHIKSSSSSSELSGYGTFLVVSASFFKPNSGRILCGLNDFSFIGKYFWETQKIQPGTLKFYILI